MKLEDFKVKIDFDKSVFDDINRIAEDLRDKLGDFNESTSKPLADFAGVITSSFCAAVPPDLLKHYPVYTENNTRCELDSHLISEPEKNWELILMELQEFLDSLSLERTRVHRATTMILFCISVLLLVSALV